MIIDLMFSARNELCLNCFLQVSLLVGNDIKVSGVVHNLFTCFKGSNTTSSKCKLFYLPALAIYICQNIAF